MDKNRVAWIDFARVLAIISVVVCHAIEIYFFDVWTGKISATSFNWYFGQILYSLGRLGVPFFLMITGTLMLGRTFDIKKFYKNSLLPLFITTEIWTVISYFYGMWYYSLQFDIKDFVGNILFLKSSPLNHMWYMPMILGIYLVLPFVANALKGVDFKNICLPILFGFIVFSMMEIYNAFAGQIITQLPPAQFKIDVSFLGGFYGLIMILGYFVSNKKILARCPKWVLIVVFAVSFIINTLLAKFFYNRSIFSVKVFVWYTSPFIIVSAICLFEILRRMPIEKNSKVVTLISKGSFTIYLTHQLVLLLMDSLLNKIPAFFEIGVVLQTFIRFTLSFGIPVLFVWIADKLPFPRMKKLLLFMK